MHVRLNGPHHLRVIPERLIDRSLPRDDVVRDVEHDVVLRLAVAMRGELPPRAIDDETAIVSDELVDLLIGHTIAHRLLENVLVREREVVLRSRAMQHRALPRAVAVPGERLGGDVVGGTLFAHELDGDAAARGGPGAEMFAGPGFASSGRGAHATSLLAGGAGELPRRM